LEPYSTTAFLGTELLRLDLPLYVTLVYEDELLLVALGYSSGDGGPVFDYSNTHIHANGQPQH